MDSSRASLFTKIYAGFGGIDSYTNAISDLYQDNFDEGIFTGKGIYDLKAFHKILNDEIPENTVLSHDLLEGSYLRCGLATDILLMDGYPVKYNSSISRLHRWVRGDWQLLGWLNKTIKIKNGSKKTNPLNRLSKFKILDNLRRSLLATTSFIAFLLYSLLLIFGTKSYLLIIISLVSILMPTILDLINLIVFKKNLDSNFILAGKNIVKVINPIKASALRSTTELILWPYKSYKLLNAVIKTIYRLKISKQNLLEWMTSDEAEKQSKTNLSSYYKEMIANIITSAILIILGIIFGKVSFIFFSIIFIIGPTWAWYISKEYREKEAIEKISNDDRLYILAIGKRTWQYFKDNINEENNFLPPDNYQEDRKEKIAKRTSPTNIGLRITINCFSI